MFKQLLILMLWALLIEREVSANQALPELSGLAFVG